MASDLEEKAKEAFVEDHFELAADLLTQAIDLDPNKPALYADRAQANIKLNNFTGITFTVHLFLDIEDFLGFLDCFVLEFNLFDVVFFFFLCCFSIFFVVQIVNTSSWEIFMLYIGYLCLILFLNTLG